MNRSATRSKLIGKAIAEFQQSASPTLNTMAGHVNQRLAEHGYKPTTNGELTAFLMIAPPQSETARDRHDTIL